MSKEILKNIIEDFNPEKFTLFFRGKNRSFAPRKEELKHYDDERFSNGIKLGEIQFAQDEKMLICAFEVVGANNNSPALSERSSKKAQYEKGKRILKDTNADAGIFIFYSNSPLLEGCPAGTGCFPLSEGCPAGTGCFPLLDGCPAGTGCSPQTRGGRFRFSLIYPEYTGTKRQWSYFKRFTYFVSPELTNKTFLQQIGEGDFSSLQKIKEAFSVDPVTKQFYNELQHWYFWAMDKIKFPDDYKYSDDPAKDKEIRNATNLIRLITRIIFIWFLMEKGLIPQELFRREKLQGIVKDFMKNKKASNFYNAILQNLFFGTLNQNMNERKFADERGYPANKKEYGVKNLYRYADKFLIDKDKVLELFSEIPFLNGGLFDCLDKEDGSGKVIYVDGFSRNPAKQSIIPDYLFFHKDEERVDLSSYGLGKGRAVRGLIEILNSYNFTIDENTPVDQEIALDPELLGKVFENLLASYNPETATTARKATGSYYTPREIVDYMVQESLVAYLTNFPSVKGPHIFPSLEGQGCLSLEGQGCLSLEGQGCLSDGVVKWYDLPYNPKLKERARELRKAGNLSEVLFWNQVKNRQFLDLDFDRQKIIGNYIVDFYCKNLGLIIEIDGSSHDEKVDYDIERDKYFENLGLKVIHILDKDIRANIQGVMQFLEKEIITKHPVPTGHPSMRGEHTPNPSMRGEHTPNPSIRGEHTPNPSMRGEHTPNPSMRGEWEERIRQLLSYSEEIPDFTDDEKQKIISAIDNIKILDPACGSGAFPMGILHKLVHALQKLDPDNKYWHELQYQKALKETEEAFKLGDKNERQERLKEINETFDEGINYPDYARKLYLIENCIYGVDIQPIAIQISKLRFFISLVLDQKVDMDKENFGIRALPNLETKFVAANTLIGLEIPQQDLLSQIAEVKQIQDELAKERHRYFNAKTRSEKIYYQRQDKIFREKLAEKVKSFLTNKKQDEINQIKKTIKEEELRLQKVIQEPENIEIIEQPNFFGGIEQIRIDKKKGEIKIIKWNIKEFEKKLKNIQKQFEGDFIIKIAKKIATFDLYDQNASADWFDPEWMFGVTTPQSPLSKGWDAEGRGGFDIVIGNPPYIFTRDADFSNDFKSYITKRYFSLLTTKTLKSKANQSGKINLFALFILRGLYDCKEKGILTYILPNNLLRTTTYDLIRKYILDNSRVEEIVDLGSGVFDNVTASTIIFRLSNNKKNSNHRTRIVTTINDLEKHEFVSFDIEQNQFLKNVSYTFNLFADASINDLLTKISENKNELGSYCIDIIEGIVAHKHLISESPSKNTMPLIEGKTIKRYALNKINKYITWNKEEIHRPRPDYLWKAPKKIIIQRISGGSNPLIATIDVHRHKTFASVNNLILKEEYKSYYEFILALLNSKVINWFYANSFSNKSELTVNISKTFLEKLPIPQINDNLNKSFITLVDQILTAKKQHTPQSPLDRGEARSADTSALERQIDEMVYKLYGLTEDEIAIVEGKG